MMWRRCCMFFLGMYKEADEEADFVLTFDFPEVFDDPSAVLAVLLAERFRDLVAVGIEELL